MATWADVARTVSIAGASQVIETMYMWKAPVRDGTHQRMVAVSYELMQPALELIDIKSAFALASEVDAQAILDNFGQLQAGAIGCTPRTDAAGNRADGILSINTTIPLAALDLSEPGTFLLYISTVGEAADRISRLIGSSLKSEPA